MDDKWNTVVRGSLDEALSKFPDRPVAGAPFSQILKRRAQSEGLEFPPSPFKTFRSFIETFKDILLVQRRAGRDVLIVPADRPDLLSSEVPDSTANRIRSDIFVALTQIQNRGSTEPFYLKDSDEVVWFDANQPKPAAAIPFVRATFEQEIVDRKTFIDSSDEHLSQEAKATLSIALQSTSPLGAFSNAVKNLQLGNAWHRFRMGAVLTRLRRWSVENGVEWNSSWISENSAKPEEVPASEQLPVPQADIVAAAFGRDFFTALAEVVTDDDLARITVPLDLVAKAWNFKIR